jgi:hypothetical protein
MTFEPAYSVIVFFFSISHICARGEYNHSSDNNSTFVYLFNFRYLFGLNESTSFRSLRASALSF